MWINIRRAPICVWISAGESFGAAKGDLLFMLTEASFLRHLIRGVDALEAKLKKRGSREEDAYILS